MEKYVIQRMVGEGSFGKVYRARRKFTGRTVAIKIINKVGKPQKEIDSLRQELVILRNLKHPNIVEMLESIETDKEFCVVMEYALGDLWEILEKDVKLPEAVVQSIAKQLVQALYYLHHNRIIHRDLKPQNVLLCANGVVKLCDFGFARAMSNNTTMLMSTKGTPLYMAPEMIQNNPYNHTADLWSLGIILFELFASKPPFFTNNVYTLIKQIINNKISYPLGMSSDFRSFLEGLLNKRWHKRMDWPNVLNHTFVRLTAEEQVRHNAALDACQAAAPWPEVRASAAENAFSSRRAEEAARQLLAPVAATTASPHFKSSASKTQSYMPMTGARMATVRRAATATGTRPRIADLASRVGTADAAQASPSKNAHSDRAQAAVAQQRDVAARQHRLATHAEAAPAASPMRQQQHPAASPAAAAASPLDEDLEGLPNPLIPRSPAKATPAKTAIPTDPGPGPSRQPPPTGAHPSTTKARTPKGIVPPAAAERLRVPSKGSPAPPERLPVPPRGPSAAPERLPVPPKGTPEAADRATRLQRPRTPPPGSRPALSPRGSPGPSQVAPAIFNKVLSHAEGMVKTKEGAAALMKDNGTMAVVRDALKRPATGIAYTQWASSGELKRAAAVACQLLSHHHDSGDASSLTLQHSLVAAARAAAAVSPATTAAIVTSAEAAAAGAAEGLLAFEGMPQLCGEMLGRPLRDGALLMVACCNGLAGALTRGQAALNSQQEGRVRESQMLMDWAKDSNLRSRLLKCAEDSSTSTSGRPGSPSLALQEAALSALIRENAAQDLASRRPLVQTLVSRLTTKQQEQAEGAMQLLLTACGHSEALCEVVCACGIKQALITMLDASASGRRRRALLLLVRLSHGLSQRTQGRPPRAVTAELLQEASFGELLSRLAALIKLAQKLEGSRVKLPAAIVSQAVFAALRKLLGWVGGGVANLFAGLDQEAQCTGLLDGPTALFQALHVHNAASEAMQQAGLAEAMVQVLASIARGVTPALSQLSPAGLLSLLQAVRAVAEKEASRGADLLLKQGVMLAMAAILKPAHLEAVHAWPSRLGGGRSGATSIARLVADVLVTPLSNGGRALQQGQAQMLQERMAQDGILGALIRGLSAARAEGDALCSSLALIWELLCLDSDSHHPFATQLLQAGGLGPDFLARLLNPRNTSKVLSPALHTLNRLTVWGSAFSQPLSTHAVPLLPPLLRHRSTSVQTAACKVIGGLYRSQQQLPMDSEGIEGAGAGLDEHAKRAGIVEALVECLADEGGLARPTACYAVGNIAYSTATLHSDLAPAIPYLVQLTRTQEVKPRSNSVGALGNMLRQSTSLCAAIISHGGLQAMLAVAGEAGQAPDPGAGAPTRPASTALFALSQACLHQACREQLQQLGMPALLERLSDLKDPDISSSCRRVQARMQQGRRSSPKRPEVEVPILQLPALPDRALKQRVPKALLPH
ncbi:hypothetical protein WJX73_004273 [Symbiochloris irregularis]|uniref:non-specific serine/threonine protein kinase n=1 Tax=Symbiochloris irregularis TaxID=706552 RepID=A0AAW1PY82_9CHLO